MNASVIREMVVARQKRLQFSLAAGLRFAGWLAVTLLAAVGVVALLFLAIGNFTIGGTMMQLNNLASRYVAADAARQGQFEHLLLSGAVIAFAAVVLCRRGSLVRVFKEMERSNG